MDHNNHCRSPTTFFFAAQQTYLELGRLTIEVCRSHTVRHTTLCRRSPARGICPTQGPVPDKHTTFSRDRHPSSRWKSNPQSQPVSSRRPTLQTADHLDRADSHLLIIRDPLPNSLDIIRRQQQLRGRVHIEALVFIVLIDKCIDNYGTVKLFTNGCHCFPS